jgi:hypothetical protein
MHKKPREEKFKLGQLHGKFLEEDNRSEAHIRQTIFLSQRLKLWRAKGKTLVIRIFGYEIPLKTGCKRGECVDLIGYDSEPNLYLIELKKEDSHEQKRIAQQVTGYKDAVEEIRAAIEKDFEKEFFFHVRFKEIKKIVLAPRKFYQKKNLIDKDVIYAYFGDNDIHTHDPKNAINIHLVEKMKCN